MSNKLAYLPASRKEMGSSGRGCYLETIIYYCIHYIVLFLLSLDNTFIYIIIQFLKNGSELFSNTTNIKAENKW